MGKPKRRQKDTTFQSKLPKRSVKQRLNVLRETHPSGFKMGDRVTVYPPIGDKKNPHVFHGRYGGSHPTMRGLHYVHHGHTRKKMAFEPHQIFRHTPGNPPMTGTGPHPVTPGRGVAVGPKKTMGVYMGPHPASKGMHHVMVGGKTGLYSGSQVHYRHTPGNCGEKGDIMKHRKTGRVY